MLTNISTSYNITLTLRNLPKRRYGGGYKLTLLKSARTTFDKSAALQLVAECTKQSPESIAHTDVGAEVTITVPLEAAQVLPKVCVPHQMYILI